jgi:heme/copper-type cytochrome/quinol oxidase subunit 4
MGSSLIILGWYFILNSKIKTRRLSFFLYSRFFLICGILVSCFKCLISHPIMNDTGVQRKLDMVNQVSYSCRIHIVHERIQPHDVKKNQILFLTWDPLIYKIAVFFSFFLGYLLLCWTCVVFLFLNFIIYIVPIISLWFIWRMELRMKNQWRLLPNQNIDCQERKAQVSFTVCFVQLLYQIVFFMALTFHEDSKKVLNNWKMRI